MSLELGDIRCRNVPCILGKPDKIVIGHSSNMGFWPACAKPRLPKPCAAGSRFDEGRRGETGVGEPAEKAGLTNFIIPFEKRI